MRWKIQSEPLLHNPPSDADAANAVSMSVWDLALERYTSLADRAEDMMVRLITAEVEADLKKHLQRYVAPCVLQASHAHSLPGDGTRLSRRTAPIRPTRPLCTH